MTNLAGLRLDVHLGETLTSRAGRASDALMELFAQRDVAVASLFRGIEGFGANRRLQVASFPDISADLPLVASAVGAGEQVGGLLGDVEALVEQGLLTLQPLLLLDGADVAPAALPSATGPELKMTIYCGRGDQVGPAPAYRAVVDQLWRQGVGGATVLLGVDGYFRGARRRAQLFGRNAAVPVAVVAVVGENEARRALSPLRDLVPDAVVTVEPVTVLKHDGVALEPLPAVPGGDGAAGERWLCIEVYSRRSDQVGGFALHGELTRQLRRLGAAGATTLAGEWGVSKEQPPRGDKLWSWRSHLPTLTRYVDTASKVGRLWPVIDEITAQFGLVTVQSVAACEERARGHVAGALRRPLEPPFPPAGEAAPRPGQPRVAAVEGQPCLGGEEGRWLRGVVAEAHHFADRCGRAAVALRVTLADGEQFFLQSADSSPGGGYLTLHPHPTSRAELLVGADGSPQPPRELIVALRSITKVELLADVPRGTRSLAVFQPDTVRWG